MVKVDSDNACVVECDCGRIHIFIFESKGDGVIDCNCGKHIEVHKC
jgi:hypothetical protein